MVALDYSYSVSVIVRPQVMDLGPSFLCINSQYIEYPGDEIAKKVSTLSISSKTNPACLILSCMTAYHYK